MNYDNSSLSASDVALLTGSRNNGFGGFGDGSGAWWIIIFLIFALGGWNNGGFGGNNGGRGSGRYRESYGHYPEEIMDEMKEQYMDYNEGREQYNRGDSYNGEEQMVQATEGIMRSITKIVEELSQSDNPQVMQIIQKNAKKMMEM